MSFLLWMSLCYVPFLSEESHLLAARMGDMEKVATLLSDGAGDVDLDNLLLEAVRAPNEGIVAALLKAGASPDAEDGQGVSALVWAMFLGLDDIRDRLIKAGADISRADAQGRTAIMNAALLKNQDLFTKLELAGASLGEHDRLQRGLLYYANGMMNEKTLAVLESKGAKGPKGVNGEHLVETSFYEKYGLGAQKLEGGELVRGRLYKDPLSAAAWGAGKNGLSAIPKDSDVHARGAHQETALHILAELGDVKGTSLAIKAGADVNAVDEDGWTPALTAAACGKVEVLKLLHKAGAKLDKAASDGSTALMWAARGNHFLPVKYLLRHKVNGKLKDKRERTALNYVARLKQKEMYKLLRLFNVPIGKAGVYGPDDDGATYRAERLQVSHEFVASEMETVAPVGIQVGSADLAEQLQGIASAIDADQLDKAKALFAELPEKVAKSCGALELNLALKGQDRDFDRAFEAYEAFMTCATDLDVIFARQVELIHNIYGRVSSKVHLEKTLALVWDAYRYSCGTYKDAWFYAGQLEARMRLFRLSLGSLKHYQGLIKNDADYHEVDALVKELTTRLEYIDGRPLEELPVFTTDNKMLDFRDYKGKGLLVDIRTVSCAPCRASEKSLKRLAKYRKTRKFDLITIFVDRDVQAIKDYIKEKDIDWLVFQDPNGHISRPVFDVRDYPTLVLLNGESEVVTNISGWGENFWNVIRNHIIDDTP